MEHHNRSKEAEVVEDWELDQSKVCLIDDPDCEACQ